MINHFNFQITPKQNSFCHCGNEWSSSQVKSFWLNFVLTYETWWVDGNWEGQVEVHEWVQVLESVKFKKNVDKGKTTYVYILLQKIILKLFYETEVSILEGSTFIRTLL